jgi:hypothetical protein
MLTEINVLGVPPEEGMLKLGIGRISHDIALGALKIVQERGEWLSDLGPRDLALFVAVQRRCPQMSRLTLLELLSQCRGELELSHELGNMGTPPSYLPPSYNLESSFPTPIMNTLFSSSRNFRLDLRSQT